MQKTTFQLETEIAALTAERAKLMQDVDTALNLQDHAQRAEAVALERVAERAVSPAESVQSIANAWNDGAIEGRIHQRGVDEAKIAAAHAEGRRSAMEELAKEKERAEELQARLDAALSGKLAQATRQAPDLSKLTRYDEHHAMAGTYMRIHDKGDYVLFEDVQALLAKPLQQEGRKEQAPVVFMDEIDAAQAGEKFLEQYYSGAVRMEYSPNDGPQIPAVKWAILLDWKDRIVAGYLLTRDLKNWTQLTRFASSDATSHPSDNLQQASTAYRAQECTAEAVLEAANAVYAGVKLKSEPVTDVAGRVIGEKVLIDSAQAAPEVADLPPLPHTTYNGYSDGSEPLYTADQMRDYARAALAATTAAAEPVYQVRDLEQLGFWSDVSTADNMLGCLERGYKTRILYRLASQPEFGDLREAAKSLYRAIVNFNGPAGPVPINPQSAMVRALGLALYKEGRTA